MIGKFEWKVLPERQMLTHGCSAPHEVVPVAVTEMLMSLRDDSRCVVDVNNPLFVRFSEIDSYDIQFDVLAQAAGDTGELSTEVMPGGMAATTLHVGDYASIPAALAALENWILEQGLRPLGAPYQIHEMDPEDSLDRGWWTTELVQFVDPTSGEGGSARMPTIVTYGSRDYCSCG